MRATTSLVPQGEHLLAKQMQEYYVDGPFTFVLRVVAGFRPVFGSYWTQVGPKLSCVPRGFFSHYRLTPGWRFAQLNQRGLWSGRWESNCIPNLKVLCFDGVAAHL